MNVLENILSIDLFMSTRKSKTVKTLDVLNCSSGLKHCLKGLYIYSVTFFSTLLNYIESKTASEI